MQLLSQEGASEVLVRPLTGDAVAIGLFNRGDKPAEISFRWDSLHLFDNLGFGMRPPTVRDLWKHEEIPATGDSFTATVPPHGVVVIQTTNGRRR